MNDKIVSALSRAFFDTQMVTARLVLALSEFLWALLLLWPGDTFGRPTYHYMASVMPEVCWGFTFLITGFVQMSIIVSENFHSATARTFAAYNALLWVFVVGSMLLSVYPPPAAVSGEIVLAGFAFWIWLRPYVIVGWLRRIYAQQR